MNHKEAIKFRRVKIKKTPLPKGKIILFILLGLFFSIFMVSFFNNTGLWNAGSVIAENSEENKTAIIRAVIEVDDAEHLNSERNFISDITDEVKYLDGIWSEEIPNEHYIRVTFEEELSSENDIKIYPRVISGTPKIEVYEVNQYNLIAEFTNIISNQYNKVFLTNLVGSQDTFDLKILDGDIEIEHIVDPSTLLRPNADGFYTDWAVGTTDYEETSDNSEITYISSTTAEQKDTMGLDNLPAGASSVYNLTIYIACKASGSGAKEKAATLIREGGIDYQGTAANLDRNNFVNLSTFYDDNPGGGEWTVAQVNALEAGAIVTTIGGGEEIQCAEVYVLVDYNVTALLDDPPNVTLNSPVNYYNSSGSVTFNCTGSDDINLVNVSLYGNWTVSGWHLNETNDTGLVNSTPVIFDKTISDGTYVWNCEACDNRTATQCNFSAANRTFTVDATDPTVVSLNYPADNSVVNSGLVDFNFTAKDNFGLANCSLYTNFTESWAINETVNNPANSTEINITVNPPEGTFIWNILCYDIVARSDWYTDNYTVTVDETNPNATINQPGNNTWTTDNSPNINITLTDNLANPINYTFYLNDTANKTGVLANNIPTNIPMDVLSDGLWLIIVEATDNASNSYNSSTLYLKIDTTAPTITLPVYQNATKYRNDQNMIFNIFVIDAGVGADDCTINVASSTNQTVPVSNGWCNETYPLTGIDDGNQTINAYANDTLGNTALNDNYVVWIDTTPPYFTDETPTNKTSYDNTSLSYDINASDDGVGLDSFSIDDTTNFSIVSSTGVITNSTPLVEYYYTVNISINDTLGNLNWSLWGLNVTETPDTTPPTIQIQSPTNTSYSTSTIWFNATADESIITWIVNYNETNITHAINTSLEVEDGFYHLLLYANDSANNFGLNDSIYFTVDKTDPIAAFGTNPADLNESNSQSITFELKCSDNLGVDELQLWGNWTETWHANQTNSSPINNTIWSIQVDNIPDGKGHVWAVWCNDSVGNENMTGTNRTFTVDTTAPTVTLPVYPNATPYKNDSSMIFNIFVIDAGVGADDCTINVAGSTNQTVPVSNGWCNGTYPLTDIGDGNKTINAYANDTLGNTALNDNYVVWLDSTAPIVSTTSVNDTSVFPSTEICINATITDSGVGIDKVWAYITYPNETQVNVTMTDEGSGCGGGPDDWYGVNFNVGSTQGTLAVNTTYANDTLGNLGDESPWPNLQVTVSDNSPTWSNPSVNDSAPNPTDTVRHNVYWQDDNTLSFAILEVNSSGVDCDTTANVTNITLSGNSQWANLTWTVPNACEGKTIGWRQYANDSSNQWNSSMPLQTYTVEDIDPIASFGTDPVDTFNSTNQSVIFELSCSDNLNVDYLILYGNWTETWHANQTNSSPINATTWSIQVDNIPEGKGHIWGVWCNDTSVSGNSDWSGDNRTFTVDATAPTVVSLNYPANNSVLNSGLVDFNFTAKDNFGLANCSLYTNFTESWAINETVNNPANSTEINITVNPPEGTFIWNILCYDIVASSDWYTYNYTVIIDETNPNATINQPGNNTWTTDNSPNINITLTDNLANPINYTFYLNDTANKTGVLANNTPTNIPMDVLGDGLWLIIVEATDNASNSYNSSTLYLKIDTTSPTVTLPIYNNATAKKSSDSLNINASVTDSGSGASNCSINVETADAGNVTVAVSSGWCNITYSLLNANEGSQTINVYANDTAGNWGLNDSYVVWIDDTAPTATINTANNTNTTDPTPDINITLTDNIGSAINYTFYINDTANKTGVVANDTPTNIPMDTLADGLYRIKVQATDNASNSANSSEIWITIDTTAPQFSDDTDDSDDSVVEGVIVNISVYWQDSGVDLDTAIFRHNASDVWDNVSTCSLSGTNSWCNKTIPTAGEVGNYICWNQYANDTLGNLNASMSAHCFSVTEANTAPYSLVINDINDKSNNSYTNDTEPEINFTVIDSMQDTLSCELWVNGSAGYGNDSSVSNDTATILSINQTLTDSLYTVYVNCSDGSLTNSSDSWWFTVDIIKPQINIDYPSNNSYLDLTLINITGTASDTNIGSVVINDSRFGENQGDYASWNFTNSSLAEETYIVKITANDSAGNENSSVLIFTIDRTSPVISHDSPANGTYFNYAPYFNGTCSDTNPGSIWTNLTKYPDIDPSSPYNFTNTSALIEGIYSVRISCNDSANNTATSDFYFTFDVTAPITTLGTNPIDHYNGTDTPLTFDLKCSDNINTSYLQLWSNFTETWHANQTNSSPVNDTYWNISVNNLPEGTFVWGAYCNDSAENSDWSSNRTLTIDRTPPTDNDPDNANHLQNSGATIGWTLSDEYAPGYYYVERNETLQNSSTAWQNNTPLNVWVNTTTFGVWNYTIFYNDSVGNSNSDEVIITITSDSAPSVTLNSPVDYYNTTEALTFNCTADDDIKLENVSLYGNWTTVWHLNETNDTPINNAPVIFDKTISDGIYVWNCYACDNATTTQCSFDTENRTFSVDTTAPTVTLPVYINATEKKPSDDLTLNILVSDATTNPESCSVYVAGQSDNQTIDYSNGWCNTTIFSLIGATEGNSTIYVYANDTVGNWGLNDSYVVWIDDTAPTITLPVYNNATPYRNDSSMIFNILVSDAGVGADDCTINVAGSTNQTVPVSNGWCNETYPLTGIDDGNQTINAYANDTLGNTALNNSYVVWLDSTAPIVSTTSVNDTSVFPSTEICINATITDSGVGIDEVWAYIIYPNGTQVNVTMTDTDSGCGGGIDNWYDINFNVGSTQGTLAVNTTYANDTVGNLGNESSWPNLQVIVLDAPPTWSNPSVNDSAPNPTDIVRHNVYWQDDNTLSFAILEVNSSGVDCDTTANVTNITLSGNSQWANLTWTVPNECEGKTIGWRQYANDSLNQWNSSMPLQTYTVEDIDPTASFGTNPADLNESSSQSITFELSCFDNLNVDYLILYGNWTGIWHANQTNSSPINDITWSIQVDNIPDGKGHVWAVWCNDSVGNENMTGNRTFTVDATAPTWSSNETNASDTTKTGESVYFNVTFSDSNPDTYIFAINQTGTWVNYSSTYTSGVPIQNISIITATEGTFVSWYFWANDTLGNSNQTDTYDFTVADSTPPQWLNNLTNASDTTKTGESVYFNVTFTDNNADSYIFSINQTGDWVNYTGTYTSEIPIQNISTITASEGTFVSWYFWANDTLGNSNQTDTYDFTIADSTSPTWSDNLTNASDTTKTGENVYFNVTFTEGNPDSYIFSINQTGDWVNYTGPYTSEIPIQNISTITATRGTNVAWYFWANDSAGNSNQTDVWNFTVANTAPAFDEDLTDQEVTTPNSLSYGVNCTDADSDGITYYVNDTIVDINSSNGTITDTPDESETSSYFLNVSCGDGYNNDSQSFTYTIKDGTAPITNLIVPADNYWNDSAASVDVNFTCNATDGYNLKNISLYITDSSNESFSFNSSRDITGTANWSNWTLSLVVGNYTWNCLAYDEYNNFDWADDNRSLMMNYTAPAAVSWNQSSLNLGLGAQGSGNLTGSADIISTKSNADVVVACSSGNCSVITDDWNDTTDMTDEQSLQCNFSCSDSSAGNFSAIFNVTSVEDTSPNQINVVCNISADIIAPTWSSNETNASDVTKTGQSVYFNVTLDDNIAGGYYIFAFYNGSDWVNDSAETWTKEDELEELRTITATRGINVSWYWWFNDSAGQANQTDVWNFTVANTAPAFDEDLTDQEVTTPNSLSYGVNCTDADSDGITYYVNDTIVDINSSNGTITDTPDESETSSYFLNVSCGDGYNNDSQSFTYTIKDGTAPITNLIVPADNYWNDSAASVDVNFTCNATDGYNLKNISLYITDSSNESFSFNSSRDITGTANWSNWTLSLVVGNYTWNCLAYDEYNNFDWADDNRTLKINYTAPDNPPTWSNPSVNDSAPNPTDTVRHNVYWQDDNELSYATLEVNSSGANCGTTDNVSSTTLSGLSQWANLTWQVPNACEGKTIGWRQYANDSENQWNSSMPLQTYTVEDIDPIAAFGTDPVDTYNSSSNSITFDLKCSDNYQVDYLILYGNWTGIWHANQTNSSPINDITWSIQVDNIPDGKGHVWAVWCNDSLGNEDWSANRTFTVDVTPPYFTDGTPQNQTSYDNESLNYDINASDDGIGLDGFAIDDTINLTIDYSTGVITNITVLVEYYYVVNVSINDTLGNLNWSLWSLNVTETPDTTPPTIQVQSPTNTSYLTSTIWFNATADELISTWIVNYNGTNITHAINTSLEVEDGFYHLLLYANDSANNFGLNDSIYFTVDATAPIAAFGTDPINNYNSTSQSITFNLSCSDNLDVDYLILYGNWTGTWHANQINSSPINATTWSIQVDNIPEGKGHIWGVWCNDSVGNENMTGTNRTFTVDVTAPTIQFVDPTKESGESTKENYIEINVTASDTNLDTIIIYLYNSTSLLETNISASGSLINYTGLSAETYFFNATANDTVGNNIPTETRNITLVLPELTIIKPENETYIHTNNLLLNYIADYEDYVWYINQTGHNETITSNTTFDVSSQGSHTLYLYANNSNGETAKNVTFTVNSSKFKVHYNQYKGGNKGDSNNFNQSSYEDLQNLSDVVLENTDYGKIEFHEIINVTDDANVSDNEIDLDTYTNISDNSIEINSTALPNLNKSATLYLYNLTFSNPRILRDSSVCPDTICTEIGYSERTLSFNVTQFTVYSAEETPAAEEPSGEEVRPSGGGSSYECTEDSECEEDEICWIHRCVKLFDIKIIDFDSPVQLGEFFEFTYFVKGMANIYDDVEIHFWIEKDGKTITSGSDTIYLGSFEEKTETTKIFLPTNTKSGIYQFYVKVYHQAYQAKSHRTIEIQVKDGIAVISGFEPGVIQKYLIIFLIALIIVIIGFIAHFERKKIKIGLIRETKWVRKHKISVLTSLLAIIVGLTLYFVGFFEFLAIKFSEAVLWFKANLSYIVYGILILGLITIIVSIFRSKKIREGFSKWRKRRRKKKFFKRKYAVGVREARKEFFIPKKRLSKKVIGFTRKVFSKVGFFEKEKVGAEKKPKIVQKKKEEMKKHIFKELYNKFVSEIKEADLKIKRFFKKEPETEKEIEDIMEKEKVGAEKKPKIVHKKEKIKKKKHIFKKVYNKFSSGIKKAGSTINKFFIKTEKSVEKEIRKEKQLKRVEKFEPVVLKGKKKIGKEGTKFIKKTEKEIDEIYRDLLGFLNKLFGKKTRKIIIKEIAKPYKEETSSKIARNAGRFLKKSDKIIYGFLDSTKLKLSQLFRKSDEKTIPTQFEEKAPKPEEIRPEKIQEEKNKDVIFDITEKEKKQRKSSKKPSEVFLDQNKPKEVPKKNSVKLRQIKEQLKKEGKTATEKKEEEKEDKIQSRWKE